MWGYVIALLTFVACLFYIRISRKNFLRNERIIHAIPDMVFILDRSLQILEIYNPDRDKLLVSPEKMIGTNLKQYFSEHHIRLFGEAVEKTLKTNKTCEVEYCVNINSETLYFEARYLKIDDNLLTCVVRDITSRKISDMKVQQNQLFLNSVLDNIPFPIMLKDIKDSFRYIYWNDECSRLSGFNRDEILGKTDIDLYGPERGGRYQEIDQKVIQNACLYRNREVFITPDGVRHDTIVTKNVIRNDVYCWLLVIRWDISDLIQTQRALKEMNQLNQLILDNSNAGFIFISPDYIVQWENVSKYISSPISRAYKRGGLCYRDVKGHDQPCSGCIMARALESGNVEREELDFDDGVVGEITATPVYDEIGHPRGVVLKVEDITLKKRVERELRQAKEDAEKSDRLKSAFLANISHEIRTPLNAIVGFSELLCHTEDKEEQTKHIRIILDNNEFLLQLISDILDISKIEANIFEFRYATLDVNQMLSEFRSSMLHKLVNIGQTEIVFKPGLSDCVIFSDKERLMQVLFNLVSNAVKFAENGKIIIGYEQRDHELYFYVSDTGIGISKDKQEEIFQRFVKLDSFKSGTGLGLSISQTIVHKLNGQIGVISEIGKGAIFWFTIPCTLLIKKNSST